MVRHDVLLMKEDMKKDSHIIAHGEDISIRAVSTTSQCEASESCRNPCSVNVVGNEFDIWLCDEHFKELRRGLTDFQTEGEQSAG